MPVVKGRKTDKKKFAGAEATYTIEAMMKDRKAPAVRHQPLLRRQVLPCLRRDLHRPGQQAPVSFQTAQSPAMLDSFTASGMKICWRWSCG